MVVCIVHHNGQTITRPLELSSESQQPVPSGLDHVHDGIVGRVEEDHDSCAGDGMRYLKNHVGLGAGRTPQNGASAAARSERVGYCLDEIIAAVEHSKYSIKDVS